MDFIIEACKTAYINTMGLEKWNALTDEQKHDAVVLFALKTQWMKTSFQ